MTAIRAQKKTKTILDFTDIKCSKNRVKKELSQCKITNLEIDEASGQYTVYYNQIKIGMYTIILHLPLDTPNNWINLKEYKDFQISITDRRGHMLDLANDSIFKNRWWLENNFFGCLKIRHLEEIIIYLSRLDKLKAFI